MDRFARRAARTHNSIWGSWNNRSRTRSWNFYFSCKVRYIILLTRNVRPYKFLEETLTGFVKKKKKKKKGDIKVNPFRAKRLIVGSVSEAAIIDSSGYFV